MNKALKIIFLLIIVSAAGFYLGTKNKTVVFLLKSSDNTLVAVPQSQIYDGADVIEGGGAQETSSSLPWYISRASAISAYLIMFLVIVWGMGMTIGYTYRIANPVKAWIIHKYISISLGIMVSVHIFSLLFDKFINFELGDILIPFASSFKAVYLSLGIISFYILLAVILSSLLLRIKSPRFWRGLHYSVYPLFAISLTHGLFIGTDSSVPAMKAVYWVTGTIFALLFLYRFFLYYFKKFTFHH